MKQRHIAAVGILTAFFFAVQPLEADGRELVEMIPATEKTSSEKEEGPSSLYALSAVLMDGDSGRVLYQKEGDVPRPNASTTKVLTCIVALENAPGDDYVEISAKAASQPEVRLGVKKGEQYYLEDLLYSLMLKSHNDSAVAIAEHIGGSVENFAVMMNKKAKEIGCTQTHFVTPNGLDASDTGGVHSTTARDLALIMRYAVKNSMFCHITQTRDYSFTDIGKKRNYSIHNTNALLDMMDGVVSGKTGYTGDAGYCYVCAWENDGRLFIVSLLGCGWPNHKSYKWSDTKKLLEYGADNFHYRSYFTVPKTEPVLVKEGKPRDYRIGSKVYLRGRLVLSQAQQEKKILAGDSEEISCRVNMPDEVEAPVNEGEKLGEVIFSIENEKIAVYSVCAEKNVEKTDFSWYADKVFHDFFHGPKADKKRK